ncbi:MAG: rhodanese-related sulfurtransferase [Buchnera aphidicola (Melaphis rhois)]
MIILHNRISNKTLKYKLLFDNIPRITVSFYKYFTINNTQKFRDDWYISFCSLDIFGRVYIAKEGINAQISVPIKKYDILKNFIYTYSPELNNVYINQALDTRKSFWVLRMKVRNTIIADGLCAQNYDLKYVGTYLKAIDVNNMLNKVDVIFLDVRNHYEYKIGHFEKALNIPVDTFKKQLKNIMNILGDEKNKRIVLYCTGGIRCEKTSSWMICNGFKYIYQIKGGILGYVNDAKKNNLPILFKGKNFVFDARISETVSTDILSKCCQCNQICDVYKNCYNNACHNLFIQCIECSNKFNNCCSKQCMTTVNYLKYKNIFVNQSTVI